MTRHFVSEIERLKRHVLSLSALVEESLSSAVVALVDRNRELAREVIDADRRVDEGEIEVEEECLKILALYQPVAIDLRYVVAVLKINSDLERIGDLAVNIAERADSLCASPEPDVTLDFTEMAALVRNMLRKALDALVDLDVDLAREVLADDDKVDAANRHMFELVQETIQSDPTPERVGALIQLLSVSRHLERIADHVTNIGEDIIYMIEGVIVRHRSEVATKG